MTLTQHLGTQTATGGNAYPVRLTLPSAVQEAVLHQKAATCRGS